MGSAFADPDFEEEQESQLTLGTTSLLSIFFGLVMICGIFFGLGYSFGRRGIAQMANMKQPAVPVPAKSIDPPAPSQAAAPVLAPTNPVLTTQLEPAPTALIPVPLVLTPKPTSRATHAGLSAAAPATALPTTAPRPAPASGAKTADPVATLLAAKQFLPKPSAIHPVLVQPSTDIAYANGGAVPSAAQIPWHWTPPFDVHRGGRPKTAHFHEVSHSVVGGSIGVTPSDTASLVDTKAFPLSHAALIVQIAALSRQDDAQVLADGLRKYGFVASIHNGDEDSLYHVQVGPFDRRIALAAQQRLLAKGYNAVVK